jgi:hypothetical protein
MGDAPPDSPDGSAANPQPAGPNPSQASEPSLTAVPDAVAAIARATRDQLIGTTVLGYVVKGKIGSGGMGIVYEGEQPTIGKRVAIKVLRPEMADKPGQVEALAAEARAVNRVGHRGIVDVFGFGVAALAARCSGVIASHRRFASAWNSISASCPVVSFAVLALMVVGSVGRSVLLSDP